MTKKHDRIPDLHSPEYKNDDRYRLWIGDLTLPDGRPVKRETWVSGENNFISYIFPKAGLEDLTPIKAQNYLVSQGIKVMAYAEPPLELNTTIYNDELYVLTASFSPPSIDEDDDWDDDVDYVPAMNELNLLADLEGGLCLPG